MKIFVVTTTYNEEKILPFFLRHYAFADKILIYDAGSTDRTLEIAKSNPLVEIRPRKPTNGEIDDGENMRVKNEGWRDCGADWVFAVDADEFMWCRNWRKFLEKCDRQGKNIVRSESYEMIGASIPESGLLTDQITAGVRSDPERFMDKTIVFKPSSGIIFGPEAHSYASRNEQIAKDPCILLHYKWLSKQDVARKSDTLKLSEANKREGWGTDPDGTPSNTHWNSRYRTMCEQARPLPFLDRMRINFIITAHARQEYLLPCVKVLKSYRRIDWRAVIVMSSMREDGRLSGIRQIVMDNMPIDVGGTGWSMGDFSKTQAGYTHFRNESRNDFRFIKVGIDSFLCDEQVIIDTFNEMENRGCGYGGNKWKEDEPSLATDIFFADTRFGNVFKDFQCTAPADGLVCFEWWMDWHCRRKGIKTKIIRERSPVHPAFRLECEALKWTMDHSLDRNLANARKWGILC